MAMVVGTAVIELKLFAVHSLKAKRKIVKSMTAKITNQFNASAAETGHNDSLEWAQIGVAMAGNNSRVMNSKLDKLLNMVDDLGLAMIADTRIEIICL